MNHDDAGRPDRRRPDVNEDDLIAYAEGRLPSGLRACEAVRAHLREDPAAAARVAAYRRQDTAIRKRWGEVCSETIPEHLEPARIRAAHQRPRTKGQGPRRTMHPLALAASLAVALVTGFLLGQAEPFNPQGPGDPAAHQTAADHSSQPPATATTNRTGPIIQPVIDADALPSQGTPHHAVAARPTVHLFRAPAPEAEPGGLHLLTGDGVNLAFWQQDGNHYALTGAVSQEALRMLAFQRMLHIAEDVPTGDRRFATTEPSTTHRQRPQLHIAPVPELMLLPKIDTDGV